MSRRRKPNVDWTSFRLADGGAGHIEAIYCERCGGTAPLKLPMSVGRFGKVVEAFNMVHEDCRPVPATEPTP